MPTLGDPEECPTCGQTVRTFTADDGTSYYVAVAEIEADTQAFMREVVDVDWKARALVAEAALAELQGGEE